MLNKLDFIAVIIGLVAIVSGWRLRSFEERGNVVRSHAYLMVVGGALMLFIEFGKIIKILWLTLVVR